MCIRDRVKYIGALWMAYLARRHPDRRLITVSPGSTSGTSGPNDFKLPLRDVYKRQDKGRPRSGRPLSL